MKNLNLDFIQRIKLTDLLSVQEGSLGTTAPFLRVLEKVRFSDAEYAQIVQIPIETPRGMMTQFQAPTGVPDFAKKKVNIEDADAKALGDLLNTWDRFSVADHAWADPITKQLER